MVKQMIIVEEHATHYGLRSLRVAELNSSTSKSSILLLSRQLRKGIAIFCDVYWGYSTSGQNSIQKVKNESSHFFFI